MNSVVFTSWKLFCTNVIGFLAYAADEEDYHNSVIKNVINVIKNVSLSKVILHFCNCLKYAPKQYNE